MSNIVCKILTDSENYMRMHTGEITLNKSSLYKTTIKIYSMQVLLVSFELNLYGKKLVLENQNERKAL